MNNKIYEELGISEKVVKFGQDILDGLKERFEKIDETAEYNQLKVIKAMQENKVSEACLLGTTGYGYNDIGREKLEAVYASVFHTEDALVRPQITCGTHALALSLTFFTYVLIRKFADSKTFAFGTGKFGTLSGFASSRAPRKPRNLYLAE